MLLQAFLQRVVNSGGRVEREYGLGRMRTDLLILWPAGAPPDRARRMVIECNLLRHSLEETIRTGLNRHAPTWTAAPPLKERPLKDTW